jgi:formate dehydrogenase alpha subunit
MVRKDGELSPVSWDVALSTVAERLRAIKKEYGPQSVAFLGSSKCTLEENYLFQKMARVIMGTHNVDHISYGWGRSIVAAIDEKLDGGGRITRLDALENAELIFVMGADPTRSVPVAGYAIKRAARFRGVPLIVVDPRKTGLVPFASQWLPLLPRSDYALISALAALLYQRQAYDSNFIARYTSGFDQYREELGNLDLEKACRVSGLGMEVLERAADLVAGKKVSFVLGRGVLQQKHGGPVMEGLLNLALMTAGLQAEGGSFYYAATENNQIGAWDMGSAPDWLPGRRLIRNDTHRRTWEQHWGTKLSPDPGLSVVRMVEAAEKGRLKALYVMGENPLRSLPQPDRVREALDRVEFTIVQDILFTETAGKADVVMPGAAFSEKGGAFTNLEGRIQPFEPVLSPPGEALPDWEILGRLFAALGYSQSYDSLQDIREEIGQLIPMYGDVDGLKEPTWVKAATNRRLFHTSAGGEPIPFSSIIPFETGPDDQDYPFQAILGSLRVHLGSGTRTDRSNRVKGFALTGAIELSREDGNRLNLKDGDRVTLFSPHGSISREITLRKDLRPGLIFVPIGFHGNDAIQLIDLAPLGDAGSPGWNVCPVKIEKVE